MRYAFERMVGGEPYPLIILPLCEPCEAMCKELISASFSARRVCEKPCRKDYPDGFPRAMRSLGMVIVRRVQFVA